MTNNLIFLITTIVAAVVLCLALWRADRQAALLTQIGEAAERQRAIFDGAMDTILTISPSGRIESVNAAGLRLLGYEELELLGDDVGVLIDMTSERFRAFLGLLSSDENLNIGLTRELVAKHKSGLDIPVDVALRAMRLSDGVHVVAVVRDNSDRRRIDEMKDSFIATVSHELRTPLTSIAGSLSLLKGGASGQLPRQAYRLVEIAEANSARLVRLINDILDMEKMRSGAVVLHRKPIRLEALVEASRDAMSGFAFSRDVTLILRPVNNALWVLVDYDRMMQVMTNLLSNAIKVSKAGSEVRLAVTAQDLHGRITVADAGPGVPSILQGRIFERFFQADGTDGRPFEGTGLGLSIVRDIVERHDGLVGFNNNVESGATFFVDLLLVEPPQELQSQSLDDAVRILICEEDELIAEVLSEQLSLLGYRADMASTANAARHALHTGNYAALLLDVRLPDSDGITLMSALRSAPATASLPIVMMSGSSEHQEKALMLGAVDWLAKPISMDGLEAALKLALRPSRTAPALILHIDDDQDLLEIARSRLGALGEVVTAPSLAVARALIAKRHPDLIILDMGLRDGSGETLLAELRMLNQPIPTIIYSAEDLAVLPEWPVVAILVKSRLDLQTLARRAKIVLEEGGFVSA